MKKTYFLMLPVFILAMVINSCKKSESQNTTPTTDDALEMAASALSGNSNGAVNVSIDAALNAQALFDLNMGCGATKTYTYSRQNATGSTTTYNYNYGFNYTVNCNASNVPDYITGTATASGAFESPRMKATATGTGTFRVGGLTAQAAVYVISGEWHLTGSFASKTGAKATSSVKIVVGISSLQINKTTKAVVTGTGTLIVKDTKEATVITGPITFTDGGKVKLTVNGVVYVIDLLTGLITK